MRSWMKLLAIGAVLLVVGCGDSKSETSAAITAKPAPAAPAAPAAAAPPTPEAADTSVVVSGPIIVEHQVEITAQREGCGVHRRHQHCRGEGRRGARREQAGCVMRAAAGSRGNAAGMPCMLVLGLERMVGSGDARRQ